MNDMNQLWKENHKNMSASEFNIFVLLEARKYKLSKGDCRTLLALLLGINDEMLHLARFENMLKAVEMRYGLRLSYECGLVATPSHNTFESHFRA